MQCAILLVLLAASTFGQLQLEQVNTAIGDFSFRLLKKTQKNNENTIHSAYSIATALGMCLIGAKDQTQTEMRSALSLGSMSVANIKSGFQQSSEAVSLMTGSSTTNDYILAQANRLYANASQPPKQPYKNDTVKYFKATIETVNFRQQLTVKNLINTFVKTQTKNLIPELLSDVLDADTVLTVVNALYFKGVWQKQMANSSISRTFNTPASGSNPPQWMTATTSYRNGQSSTLGATLVELPYISNSKIPGTTASMILILPNSSYTNMSDWVDSRANWADISSAINALGSDRVVLTMPRFDVDDFFDLGEALSALGMPRAFTDMAQFGDIVDLPIKISKVFHKAKMVVHDKGTEAAAATAVVFEPVNAISGPTKPIFIDRPFLSLIVLKKGTSRVPIFTAIINKL